MACDVSPVAMFMKKTLLCAQLLYDHRVSTLIREDDRSERGTRDKQIGSIP